MHTIPKPSPTRLDAERDDALGAYAAACGFQNLDAKAISMSELISLRPLMSRAIRFYRKLG